MKRFFLSVPMFLVIGFLFGCEVEKQTPLPVEIIEEVLSEEVVEEIVDEVPEAVIEEALHNAELVFVSPENNAKDIIGKTPVTFMWSKPLFALQNTRDSQKALEKSIQISPPMKGSWQQLGSTGVLFEPKEAWQHSTHYVFTLPFSEASYNFTTAKPLIKEIRDHSLIEQKELEVVLNQEVSLAFAQKVEFIPALDFEVTYKKEDKKTLLYSPKEAWPENATFKFVLPNSTEYEASISQKSYKPTFQTIRPFLIENMYFPNDVFSSFSIRTNSKFSQKDLLDHLTIEPIDPGVWTDYVSDFKKNIATDYKSQYAWLSPVGKRWKAHQEYTIRISKDFTDQYGRTLLNDYVSTFNVQYPNKLQGVYFPSKWTTYQTGTFPEYSAKYSGNIISPVLSLERVWPHPSKQEIALDWKPSFDKENVETLPLSEIFSETIGTQASGVYEATLKYKIGSANSAGRLYERSVVSLFGVGDFLLEAKEVANGDYQVWGHTVEGEKLQINTSYTVLNTGAYNQSEFKVQGPFDDSIEASSSSQLGGILLAQSGDLWGVVSASRSLSPHDLPVSFSPWKYKQDSRSVGFSDRPLYRPGDTVFFETLFRELQLHGKNFPLKELDRSVERPYKISVQDPQYKEIFSTESQTKAGGLSSEWKIPSDASLGAYSIEIQLFDSSESASEYGSVKIPLYVTEYRKPDFLVWGSFDTDKALWQQKYTANVKAEYAFGGTLAGKSVDYKVSLFGHEPSDWWWRAPGKKDKLLTEGKGTLDEEGNLHIPIDLDISLESEEGTDTETQWQVLTIDATVFASKGEKSSFQTSVPFYASEYQLELDRLAYFYQVTDTEINFSGKVTDLEEAPKKTEVKAELIRRKWARNDRKEASGDYVGEWHWVEELVQEETLSSDKKGVFSGIFPRPETAGQYRLRVTAKDKKKRAVSAQGNFYVWTPERDSYVIRQNNLNNILPVFLERDEYEIGDRATVLFPHTEWEITRAHVTLERGELLETLEADLVNQTARFEVESWMAPNVVVSVLLEGKDETGKPRVKWGAIDVTVKDPMRALDVQIIPLKDTFKPGETAQVEVRTSIAGQPAPAQVTLSVVDQTLLALKARRPLNLSETLLAKLPLGVKTLHTAGSFVSEQELQAIYEKVKNIKSAFENPFGGGGGKGDQEASAGDGRVDKPRGDFRDTAAWLSQIQIDASGKKIVDITLPDNLTTWNVWAVGSTDENAFGEGESSFKTTLPLLISPITPNFFRYGDKTQAGLLIRRNTDTYPSEKVQVTFDLTMPGQDPIRQEQTLKIKDEQRVLFDVEIPYSLESFQKEDQNVVVDFSIRGLKSDLSDSITLARKLVPPTITSTAASFVRVKSAGITELSASNDALKSVLKMRVFGTLLEHLSMYVNRAKQANFGCSEQLMTYWTSNILQNQIFALVGKKTSSQDLNKQKEALQKILKNQKSNGGFGFWPGSSMASPWGTTHILEFAPAFSDAGSPFPAFALQNARNWLKKEIFKTSCAGHFCGIMGDTVRQQAGFILLRDGLLKKTDLEFLSSFLKTFESKIWFMKSVHLAGKENVSPSVQKITETIETQIKQQLKIRDRYAFWEKDENNAYDFFTQNERLTALVFEAWVQENIYPELHDSIARYLSQTNENISGNTALRILIALRDYQKTLPENNFPASFVIEAEGLDAFKGKLNTPIETVSATEMLDPGALYKLNYKSENEKSYFLDVELQEVHKAKDMQSVSHGFWIERNICDLFDEDCEKPLTELEIGKNYQVQIKVVTNASHRQVMVQDTIVSGADAVNFDLDNEDKRLKKPDPKAVCYGWCQPLVAHKEFYFDKARFFVENMRPGTHQFSYILKARLQGEYEQSAPKVIEMYNPEVMATGVGEVLTIKREK